MKISLAILTFNERQGLDTVFDRLPLNAVDEVFAMDKESTDGSLEFLKAKNIPVYQQTGGGRGRAMRQAMERATGDAVIFFSPDGNEDPADIVKFRPLLEQGSDIVIASRMMKGAWNEEDGQTLKLRKWANNAFNALANMGFRRTGPYVTDSINGYRALTKKAFAELNLDATHFTIEYQMTMRALKKQMKIVEFPTHEGARVGRKSGAKSIPTGIAFIKCFLAELT